MHKNIRISTTIERPNERIITTYQNYSRKSGITDSFYSLRKTNVNIAPKEFKINTNNKYLICNTSPNVKISKHLNLTKTIQNIPRSSHSKEVYSNNKLLNKNNILTGARTNTNYSINNSINSSRTNKFTNRSQTINFSLTENSKKPKYQKITINNNPRNNFYANLNNVRISHKPFGIIQAYSTITTKGKRDYNEDRVSIIYNIPKPPG